MASVLPPSRHSCVGRNPVGAQAPQTERNAPRLPVIPGLRPTAKAGTYPHCLANGCGIPAYAGMTDMGG